MLSMSRGVKQKLTPQVDLHIYNFSGCLTARYPAKLIARGSHSNHKLLQSSCSGNLILVNSFHAPAGNRVASPDNQGSTEHLTEKSESVTFTKHLYPNHPLLHKHSVSPTIQDKTSIKNNIYHHCFL